MYGETWLIKLEHEVKLYVTKMDMLRWIQAVSKWVNVQVSK